VDSYPPGRDATEMAVIEGSTYADLRILVETSMQWVYAERQFFRVPLQMSKDDLRLFQWRRYQVPVSIRFVRVSGGISLTDIQAGTTIYQYTGLFPDGQDVSFNSNQERGFTEGLESPDGESGKVVRTTRKTVSSGLGVDAYVSCMPGQWARIVGQLNVSAFTGSGLDRSSTDVPLSVDLPRGKWQTVHVFSALDAAASLVSGEKPTIRAGADWVRVDVRVD